MAGLQRKTHDLRALVLDEVRLIVADAVAAGGVLWIGPHARRLSRIYAGSGMSEGRIADELILAASAAKVPVEMSRPGLSQRHFVAGAPVCLGCSATTAAQLSLFESPTFFSNYLAEPKLEE